MVGATRVSDAGCQRVCGVIRSVASCGAGDVNEAIFKVAVKLLHFQTQI